MKTVCTICASTEGPFTQEKTGVSSSPNFTKCQSCNLKFPAITFRSTVGFGPSRSSFVQYFYECPKCRTLFYRAIPYAFTHFGVTACPNCKRAFPNGEDIKYPDTSKTNRTVFTNYGLRYSLEELEPLYEKLVAKQPKLSKVIANIMLVKTAKGNDIWVVCQGSDYNVETDLRSLLWAYSDKKLPFSSQATLEGVKKTDGLSIVKQMKGS